MLLIDMVLLGAVDSKPATSMMATYEMSHFIIWYINQLISIVNVVGGAVDSINFNPAVDFQIALFEWNDKNLT